MENKKIGEMILRLRHEKGFTQAQLADMLGVTDKAVSKWERGNGCPDISLWPSLTTILGADIEKLLLGEIHSSKTVSGNMSRTQIYICPDCKNILTAGGNASISCCGRRLLPLKAQVPSDGDSKVSISEVDGEMYVQIAHEATKEHHIMFIACITGDKIAINRLYPEQSVEATFSAKMWKSNLYYYCTKSGLFMLDLKKRK